MNMTCKFLSLSLLLALLELSAAAQSKLSLDSILTVVRVRNSMLKNYGIRAQAMRAYAEGAKAWMAPEAGGGLWMVPYKRTSDDRNKGQVMISVQQKFTNPAKRKATRSYLESKAAIEEASQSAQFNELRSSAKLAYTQWIVYEKKKRVLDKQAEIIQLMQKLAEKSIPYRGGSLGEVYKTEARAAEINNLQLVNDDLIVQKNIQLNQLMNISDNIRFQIDTTWSDPAPTDEIDTALLAARRSDVFKLDKNIQALRFNKVLETTQSRPDFNLSFNHMIARGAGMPNQFMLLGMISIPIAPWSARGYAANAAGIDKEISAMQNERAAILRDAQGVASGMNAELASLRRQVENYETRIIPALKRNYETSMLAWQENKEDLRIVLDAWETLGMTRLQYLDTVLRLKETEIGLERELQE